VSARAWSLPWCLVPAGVGRKGDGSSDLVARARRGDPSAFDEIVRRHQKRVYNLAYRMLRRREDAEDITQEAFLRAFASLPRLRDDRAVGTWVCRIAANLCLSWLRSKAHRSEVPLESAPLPQLMPDEQGASAEIVRRTRAALARHPPAYRLAIAAYHLEGCSYREAAGVCGVGVPTLKTRLYRARKMLREMLASSVFCDREVMP